MFLQPVLDLSGFSTNNFGRYVDLRFGKADVIARRKWVKVHLMCGVATHIVTAAQVSKPSAGETHTSNHLLRRPIRISIFVRYRADKAYSSLANLRVVTDKQAMPNIRKALLDLIAANESSAASRLSDFAALAADLLDEVGGESVPTVHYVLAFERN